ncbi:ABC transporter permease [Pseudocnuella soli]|uniref:ABC transporter permease n=1 Tax=Pseudocnuella soli TaxID=2502779 RepID=UPI00104CB284|nr:ABC transporter permease [Pseudocnuella soli]
MLKNYFKIAIAVLKRRKFFTFISLFGIAFTLTILIVATAFVDNAVSANYPEANRDRSLYINMLEQRNPEKGYSMNGPMSYHYASTYISTLKTPEKVALGTMFTPTNTYVANKKLVIDLKLTNAEFWDVMQFHFLEGKPYGQQQIANNELVAVISEETRREYFGDVASVVGKTIETDNVKYKVMGVVKSVPVTMLVSYADMYVPYTASKTNLKTKSYNGMFMAVLMGRTKADLPKMKAEYASVVAKVPPGDAEMKQVISHADKYLESFVRSSPLRGKDGPNMSMLYLVLVVFVLLFMLLPTLNLVNINISRIMERSSEIGVRKAFGASSGTLIGQFVVENLILTAIGTVIGVALSFIVLQYINSSGMIANIHLTINFTVLLYSVIACIVFGLLSGVYPAWRMSRLQVVAALKA